jgi:solute carrier family 25 carnitine/acylcarnitine transporter 20/29
MYTYTGAGWTVSLVATPVEHIKARLQVQYGDTVTRVYTGPIDCARKLVFYMIDTRECDN